VDVDNVWDLYRIELRLENLCSLLENPETQELITPERALLERIHEGGGEVSDRFLLNILGNEIARIEVSLFRPWFFGSRANCRKKVMHQHARAEKHCAPVRSAGLGVRAHGGHLFGAGGAAGRAAGAEGGRGGGGGAPLMIAAS
jgi:hypothetical protein